MSDKNSENRPTIALDATALVLQDGTIVSLSASRESGANIFRSTATLIIKNKRMLLLGIVGGVLLGLIATWTLPRTYSARIVVEPGAIADTLNQGGLLNHLSNSLNPFGAQIPQMEKDFLQLLQSNAIASKLLHDQKIIVEMFPEEWDSRSKSWRPSPSLTASVMRSAHLIMGGRVWSPPDVDRVKEYIKTHLTISPISDGSLQEISLTTGNPKFAAMLLSALVQAADDYLRNRESMRASASIKYWQAQLDRATSQDLRNALIAAIVDSQRRAVFADVDLPFSVEVTDPVSVPDRSSGPKALLVMVGAIFLGLAISVFWIVYREFRAKPPMPRS